MPNLTLPGNPRYQPKDLQGIFGYDNLAKTLVEVELAVMDALTEVGIIPKEDRKLLTQEHEQQMLAITTSQMDERERAVTKHDIRALVQLMQEIMPKPLRRWVHVPLTSYDVIDTARTLQFLRAHRHIVKAKLAYIVGQLANQVREHAEQVQIGRTHGQHALPVTVGFWLATILNRVIFNAAQMNHYAGGLVGKVSGAVGAYNAQVGLGFLGKDGISFETRVLRHLDLKPAEMSTQILPPEPLYYYLASVLGLSAAFGQFGRDGRNLMRTEIAELSEPFDENQVGSSTMAHKRNPINFENIEGTWLKNKNEFGKVLDTMISDHQRDLVGSCVSRDFPTMIVNLVSQMDTLLRQNKDDGRTFLQRLTVSKEACKRNFALAGDTILAEPVYLAIQMYGYEGDAHNLVNHKAMPLVREGTTLVEAIGKLAEQDSELREAWYRIPAEIHRIFRDPRRYTGLAREKALEVCDRADAYLRGK